MAPILHFWFDLVLAKIEQDWGSQVSLVKYKEPTIFPPYFLIDHIYRFLFMSGLNMNSNRYPNSLWEYNYSSGLERIQVLLSDITTFFSELILSLNVTHQCPKLMSKNTAYCELKRRMLPMLLGVVRMVVWNQRGKVIYMNISYSYLGIYFLRSSKIQ